jgi:ATP-dependent DNA helicase RecG
MMARLPLFDCLVIKHDRPPRGVRRPYRVFCENETGALELVFFHAHDDYVAKQLPIGERRLISGRVELFQGPGANGASRSYFTAVTSQ